jgi:hypothetical protein
MKHVTSALVLSITFLGLVAQAQAAPEIQERPVAVQIPSPTHHPSVRAHHDKQIVLNGITRHELDVHPGGG